MAGQNKNANERKISKTPVTRNKGVRALRNLSNAQKTFWTQSEAHKKLLMEITDELFDLSELERDFCSVVQKYIKLRGYNKIAFFRRTLLSDKYFQRIMENKVRRPAREAVMAICVGLNLWEGLGEELFEAAGYKMNAEMLEKKSCIFLKITIFMSATKPCKCWVCRQS